MCDWKNGQHNPHKISAGVLCPVWGPNQYGDVTFLEISMPLQASRKNEQRFTLLEFQRRLEGGHSNSFRHVKGCCKEAEDNHNYVQSG